MSEEDSQQRKGQIVEYPEDTPTPDPASPADDNPPVPSIATSTTHTTSMTIPLETIPATPSAAGSAQVGPAGATGSIQGLLAPEKDMDDVTMKHSAAHNTLPWYQRIKKDTIIKLLMLACYYCAQGLPFGFQASIFPLILRTNSVKKSIISVVVEFLSVPWILKPLWAPLIDTYPVLSSKMHWLRRKYIWLIPQGGLLAVFLFSSAGVAGTSSMLSSSRLTNLGILIFFQNCMTASMDVAVDGTAVDCLRYDELGFGNSVQTVAYKIGILIGGSLLGYTLAPNWTGTLTIIAILVLFTIASGVAIAEMKLRWIMTERVKNANEEDAPEQGSVKDVWKTLGRQMCRLDQRWVIGTILLYKVGETIGDRMFSLFLVDYGYTINQISNIKLYGDIVSIFGSILGGYIPLYVNGPFSFVIFAALTVFTQLLRLLLVTGIGHSIGGVIFIQCIDTIISGAFTTVMFSFMMSQVDRDIGASHYTMYAVLEAIGKGIPSIISGSLTDKFGYPAIFTLTVVFQGIFVFVASRLLVLLKTSRNLEWRDSWRPFTGKVVPKKTSELTSAS